MKTIPFCSLCLALATAPFSIADPVPEAQRWWPSAWGPEDERGAANRMTSDKVLEARALITTGKVYSLGRLYEEGMPLFGKRHYSMTMVGSPSGGPAGGGVIGVADAMAERKESNEEAEPGPDGPAPLPRRFQHFAGSVLFEQI